MRSKKLYMQLFSFTVTSEQPPNTPVTCPGDQVLVLSSSETAVSVSLGKHEVSFVAGQYELKTTLPDNQICSWRLTVRGRSEPCALVMTPF